MVFLIFALQTCIFAVLYPKSIRFVATVQQKQMFGFQKAIKPYGFIVFFAETNHFDNTVIISKQKHMILTILSTKSYIQQLKSYVLAEAVSKNLVLEAKTLRFS